MFHNMLKILLAFIVVLSIFRWGYQKSIDQDVGRHTPQGIFAQLKKKKTAPGRKPVNRLPVVSMIPGNAQFSINGIPADIDAYLSEAPLEQEKTRFTAKWTARGYQVSSQTFGNASIVSAYDKNKKNFKSVILIPGPGQQETHVIPSNLDLSKPPEKRSLNSPVYPQSKSLFHIESNDMAGYSENLILMSSASIPSIMSYYKNKFLSDGWQTAKSPELIYNPQYLDHTIFVKGADERWVYASKIENSDESVIYLLYNDKNY